MRRQVEGTLWFRPHAWTPGIRTRWRRNHSRRCSRPPGLGQNLAGAVGGAQAHRPHIGTGQRCVYTRYAVSFQPLQAPGNRIEEFVALDRLVQEIVRAEIHALAKTVPVIQRGQENHRDRCRLIIGAHGSQHAETVHVWHLHVGNNDVGTFGHRHLQALQAVRRGDDVMIRRSKVQAHQLANGRVIFDD